MVSSRGDIVHKEGGWGWMVVIGSHIIQVLAAGMVGASGLLIVAFVEEFEGSLTETSWVVSLAPLLAGLFGPVSNILAVRYGHRKVCFIGGLMIATSAFISTYADSLFHLYFLFGVVGGIGSGLLFAPSNMIVGVYFKERFTLAYALSSAGFSMGFIILPPIIAVLITQYGWRYTLIIASALNMNICVCACLFRPLRRKALHKTQNLEMTSGKDLYVHDQNDETMCKEPINNDIMRTPNFEDVHQSGEAVKASKVATPGEGLELEYVPCNNNGLVHTETAGKDTVHVANIKVITPSRASHIDTSEADRPSNTMVMTPMEDREIDHGPNNDAMPNEPISEAIMGSSNNIDVASSCTSQNDTREPERHSNKLATTPTEELEHTPYDNNGFVHNEPISKDIVRASSVGNFDPTRSGTSQIDTVEPGRPSKHQSAFGDCLKTATKTTGVPELCTSVHYPIILFTGLTIGIVYVGYTIYIVPRAIQSGFSSNQAAVLITVYGIGCFVGRFIPGILVDLKYASTQTLLILSLITAAIELLLSPLTDNYALLVVLSLTFGLSMGISTPLCYVISREVSAPWLLAPALGYNGLAFALGNSMGGLFGGWIYDVSGDYGVIFYVYGGIMVLASVLFVPTLIWLNKVKASQTK